jgi:diadenosine tetraphosphate (Ap4A) HIT family hydrolase
MNCFIREKKIYCGKNYREIDLFTYSGKQAIRAKQPRGKREKISAPKQKNLNDKNALRYFEQLVKTNCDSSWLSLGATYSRGNLPGTLEDAQREMTNFLRRLKSKYKKQGLELKYIVVTTNTSAADGSPARIHHHILINGGLDRDLVESVWSKRGKKIGTINADRLDMDAVPALCKYLKKQQQRGTGKKGWVSSHNLKKPETTPPKDGKYSIARIERLARMPTDCEEVRRFFETQNKDFDATSIVKTFNPVTGSWAFTVKMKRRERR